MLIHAPGTFRAHTLSESLIRFRDIGGWRRRDLHVNVWFLAFNNRGRCWGNGTSSRLLPWKTLKPVYSDYILGLIGEIFAPFGSHKVSTELGAPQIKITKKKEKKRKENIIKKLKKNSWSLKFFILQSNFWILNLSDPDPLDCSGAFPSY